MAAAPSLCRAIALVLVTGLLSPALGQEVTLTATGAEEELTDRLRAASLLLQDTEEPRTAQDVVAAARADYARLIGVLYEFGFFAPVVRITLDGREAARLSPFAVPGRIGRVQISIDPGTRFTFGRATIGPLADGTILPDGFRGGSPASTPILQDATRAALDGWRAVGRATADVASQRITARHREATLDAEIAIDPGPVISFGALIPRGQDRMRPERIVEIAGLPAGALYSPRTLARAEERLRDTGVFSAVALEETPPSARNTMDIEAVVVESAPRRIGFGAEFSTDDGVALNAYWMHRNLFGGAERLRFDLEVNGIGQGELSTDVTEVIEGIDAELTGRFSRPATFTPDTTLYLETGIVGLDEPTYRVVTVSAGGGVEHVFSDTLTGRLGLELAALRVEDDFGTRDLGVISSPASLTFDSRDDALDARSGLYLDGKATPFNVFEEGGAARVLLDGRAYLALGEARRSRLAGRVQVGSVFGGEVEDIPPDFLFYSGGSDRVRGQDYRALGADYGGVEAGGRGLLAVSGEFRQDIGDTDFGVVAFADAGYVSAAPLGQDDGEWHAGAGLGIRYSTPFGPIRVDLATPIRGGNVGEDLFLYIGIGQAF